MCTMKREQRVIISHVQGEDSITSAKTVNTIDTDSLLPGEVGQRR